MACCLGNNKITALKGIEIWQDMNTQSTETMKNSTEALQDMHGFHLKGSHSLQTKYSEWYKHYAAKQSERALRWSNLLKKSQNSRFNRCSDLKKLVRKGIPNSLRGQVWMDLSGATQKLAENPGLYRKHVDSAETGANALVLAQIELDLHRTFPDHPLFSSNSSIMSDNQCETAHILALRRVLRAYACRNAVVGYCQGMNFVAGLMLLFLEEERVYWLLAMLLETILPRDYYSHDLIGCSIDLRVFGDLLTQRLPKVAKAFSSSGVGVEFFALEWFIALFSKTLPSETVLRIWDCIFSEGDKILFRLGLGILRTFERDILAATEQNDVLQMIQGIGKALLDADVLLKSSFSIYLKREHIHLARTRYRESAEKERKVRASRSTEDK